MKPKNGTEPARGEDASKDRKRRADERGSAKDRDAPSNHGERKVDESGSGRNSTKSEAQTKRSNETTQRRDRARKDAEPSAQRPAPEMRELEAHERELEAATRLRSAPQGSKPVPERRASASGRAATPPPASPAPSPAPSPAASPAPPAPSPSSTDARESGLERAVSSSDDERAPLEDRVTRSADPRDLARMRTLADKVYQQGWNRLSTDEQLAFMYHARFLDYLSAKEKEREDVQATMYRFVTAQGKNLGLTKTYATGQLSVLNDRFFGTIKTPQNSPELYRELANTDYLKAERRR